ncbi:MAG: serine hydrolase [Lachnospiraceae bacterium]|nr:serine hydrolase [Lachnospiraceae bacterium]
MRKHRRHSGILSAGLAVIGLALFLCLPAAEIPEVHAEEAGPDVYGESYCVIDGNTGEILISKNAHERLYPASTTKILTALLVLENVQNLNQYMTFTPTAINIDPSSSTLDPKAKIGERMTVKDALYGMLLKSANECGAMLGEFVAGSEAAFAAMMNARAAEIGARDSHFMNAYGIHHPDHYTTAYDLCLILRAALQNARYRELNRTIHYHIAATNMTADRWITNGHGMINGNIPEAGVIGGKTGSTPQAGKVLTTAVDREGLYTVTAVMRSDVDNMYTDTQVVLEYVYGRRAGTVSPYHYYDTYDQVQTTAALKLRTAPSLKGGISGSVPAGTVLQRIGYSDGWSHVIYGNRTFYVSTAYLTVLPSPPPETTPPVTGPPETDPPVTDPPETPSESASGHTEVPSESEASSAAPSSEASPSEPSYPGSRETESGGVTSAEPGPSGTDGSGQGSVREGTGSASESGTAPPGRGTEPGAAGKENLLAILLPAILIVALLAVWGVLFARHLSAGKNRSRREGK